MKIAVLWTDLSGYLNGCLEELASREGVDLFVACSAGSASAPFEKSLFKSLPIRYLWNVGQKRLLGLGKCLEEFSPDLIIFTGWAVPGYREVAQAWRGRARRVMTMDNCWLGSPKQWLGILTAPLYVMPLADAVWLPGERQAVFAEKLGFRQSQIYRGLYTCDTQHFAPLSLAARATRNRTFLFAGRFIREKGLDVLVEAYKLYRKRTSNAWSLRCVGTGPLGHLLIDIPGVTVDGFVQPEHIPEIFAAAECLVLPSVFEPWAVVVHEAASLGLLVLAAASVGSSPHLVQPGYNGYIFDSDSVESLAASMLRVSVLSPERRLAMSENSISLASQFTTERWADTVLELATAKESQTEAPGNRIT